MPGPFTHIYTQRRVADFLAKAAAAGGVTGNFVRNADGNLLEQQILDPKTLGGFTPQQCAALMQKWPKFAAVGAVGPDLFFFLQDYAKKEVPCDEIMLAMSLLYWLDDQGRLDDEYEGLLAIIEDITGSGFVAILRFLIKLNKLWSDFMDKLNDIIGPILDAAGQLINDATGGLLNELGDLFSTLKDDLVTLIAEEGLSWGDIFAFFSLKTRTGVDEQAFLWSDMTHYRLTSYVPRRLLEHAKTLQSSNDLLTHEHGDQLAAYALGWICHVGTDTIAHSFVNAQAGGPFRTHWQRHHLVENHMDAFNYQGTSDGTLPQDDKVGWIDGYEGLNHSAAYFAVQIPQGIDDLPADEKEGEWRKQPLPEPDSRANRKTRTEMLDVDGAMPAWIAETIVRVLVEVYASPDEGGLKTPEYVSERTVHHPKNLLGKVFQKDPANLTLVGKWLGKLGIGDPGKAMNDLLNDIAPAPPADLDVPVGFPLPWEVQVAYRFMLSWFKREFNTSFDMDKPRRPTWYTPPASDVTDLLQPPDFSGVDPSDNPLETLCEIVLAVLDWIVKEVGGAAKLLYDLAKSAASGATLLPRELLYDSIILPAWQACENMRQVLVHMAYLTPQSEMHYKDNGELRRPNEIDHELIKLGHSVDGAFASALAAAADPFGHLDKNPTFTAPANRNPKGPYPWLPIRPTKDSTHLTTQGGTFPSFSDVIEYLRPWGYPDRTNDDSPQKAGNYIETPETHPGPYPQDATPDLLLRVDGPASNRLRFDYEKSNCPVQTDQLNAASIGNAPFTNGYPSAKGAPQEKVSGINPLGDPIVFSSYLMGQIAGNPRFMSNYNLDSDRGFGYLCWDWTRSNGKDTSTPERGPPYNVPYVNPDTPPEGTVGKWVYPDPTAVGQDPPPKYDPPLKLEYPGRKCDEGPPIG